MDHENTKTRRTEREKGAAFASPSLLALCLGVLAAQPFGPLAAKARAQEATTESKEVLLQKYYDQAFVYYKNGDYAHAIQTWEDILRLDPAQKTAKDMIREVQHNIEQANAKRLAAVQMNVKHGRYRSALSGLGTLLEGGDHTPYVTRLQTALQDVALIVPEAPEKSKAWRMAVLAVDAAIGNAPDYKLAFNALRYARELAPADERIKRLLDWFQTRHPELAGTDTITAGMTFLEYKRSLALDHLYGARYHEAIDTLDEVLALEPEDLVALKRLGSAYYSLGLYPKAKDAWKRALALTPGDAQLKKYLRRLAVRHPVRAD